ncbi:MAG: outer membrane protein assembly factor BamD [Planctomycetes bacterium]|nr:outer membrane protein assembly factor BamD [Planctomycetota bacterium]
MSKYRKIFAVVMLAVVLLLSVSSLVISATWRLEDGQNFKEMSSSQSSDKYILAVAELKKLASNGQVELFVEKLEKLKKDFPQIAGSDLDSFMQAELLFCEGKFVKAVRAYDKFLEKFPESELYQPALDRQLSIATAFLGGEKKRILGVFKINTYAQAAKIIDRIVERAGKSPIASKAALTLANGYEARGKFNKAYEQWSMISSDWPAGQTGKDSLLAMGRCKHAAYKGPSWDDSGLVSADSYYRNFKSRYPVAAEEFDIDSKLEQINEQAAYKQLCIGQYYQKTGSVLSANFYYEMIANDWPGTAAAKIAKSAMTKMANNQSVGKEEMTWKNSTLKKFGKLFL